MTSANCAVGNVLLLTYAATTAAVIRSNSSSAIFGAAGSAISASESPEIRIGSHNWCTNFLCQPKLRREDSNQHCCGHRRTCQAADRRELVLRDSKLVRRWIWQTTSSCSAPCFNAKLDRRFRGATPIHGRRLALSSEIW